ncbi:MAG TPA: BatA domain-containing protein, partial [Hyphomicrobiaceae bacterium]|nr:BatA domain-containing protein [Hyphomicrobiaceae bacterium]
MTLGPVAFLSPWLLAGLLALPVIWWLLRTIPPRPRRLEFPPTRILIGIENREKTPAQTPWWLTLIRMAAAALVILALAEPVLNPTREKALLGSGPVVLVVDNGWAAAAQWSARADMMERLIAEAEGQGRPVLIAPTAHATKAVSLKIEAPVAARSTAAAVQPQPFAPERMATAQAIATALGGASQASVVWLADGVDHDGSAREFADRLSSLAAGKLAVVDTRPGQEALAAVAAVAAGGRLDAQVLRPDGGPRSGTLHAMSARGQRLGEASFSLGAGETRTVANFDMPLELRNQVTRVEIAGERSAGAVHLLDARSQ